MRRAQARHGTCESCSIWVFRLRSWSSASTCGKVHLFTLASRFQSAPQSTGTSMTRLRILVIDWLLGLVPPAAAYDDHITHRLGLGSDLFPNGHVGSDQTSGRKRWNPAAVPAFRRCRRTSSTPGDTAVTGRRQCSSAARTDSSSSVRRSFRTRVASSSPTL